MKTMEHEVTVGSRWSSNATRCPARVVELLAQCPNGFEGEPACRPMLEGSVPGNTGERFWPLRLLRAQWTFLGGGPSQDSRVPACSCGKAMVPPGDAFMHYICVDAKGYRRPDCELPAIFVCGRCHNGLCVRHAAPAASPEVPRPTEWAVGQRWQYTGKPWTVVALTPTPMGVYDGDSYPFELVPTPDRAAWTFLGLVPASPPAEAPTKRTEEPKRSLTTGERCTRGEDHGGEHWHQRWRQKTDGGRCQYVEPASAPPETGRAHAKSVHVPCSHDGPRGGGRCWDCYLKQERADRMAMDTTTHGFGKCRIDLEASPVEVPRESGRYPSSDDPDLDIENSWERSQ